MKKGEQYVGKIRDIVFPNKGIAVSDGEEVVIKNTLPGQEVSFVLKKNKPGLKEGRLAEVLRRADIETCEGCVHAAGYIYTECDPGDDRQGDGPGSNDGNSDGNNDGCNDGSNYGNNDGSNYGKSTKSCGGCVFQTIPYEEELRLKEHMVKEVIRKALKQCAGQVGYDLGDDALRTPPDDGDMPDDPEKYAARVMDEVWDGITGSPECEGYRNKMEFSFGNAVKDGPMTLGMHVSGHFIDVIDTPACNIVDEDIRKIRAAVSAHATECGLGFYNRHSNMGYLRNLLVRKGKHTGETMVDVVTTSDGDLHEDDLADTLRGLSLDGSIVSLLHTINDSAGDAVKNEKTVVIYGRDHIFDEVLGLRFKISAFSFFQTNTLGAEVLYDRVREYIKDALTYSSVGDEREDDGSGDSQSNVIPSAGVIYDLYSGTGTIAQLVSPVARHVYGIEIVEEAVEAAKANARMNGINNVSFVCGDVMKMLDEITEKPDLIILDPPRDGVSPKALRQILDYGVRNIIYVSCKVTSLARDLPAIYEAGYRMKRLSVVDMFPRTANTETVCLLSKLHEAKHHINVKVNMDELDLTSAEAKATYKEIQDWVQEKYGFHVTNLNIAQVKQKHGIIERENYNKPKSSDSKQPGCPEEKVKAIEDAMRHFQMI